MSGEGSGAGEGGGAGTASGAGEASGAATGSGAGEASGAATGSGAAWASAEAGDGRRGRLFLVSTPIGNLGDITYRAVAVLRSVPMVAAEDTRVTRRLFARYGIETPLVSYHAHSGPSRERELLGRLRDGRDLAVVTDAGTPGVSDPGAELASAWAAEGGEVVAIPGASAVLAALAVAALPAPRWTFEGFLPRSGRERRERLARIAADERATVLYEAGPRMKPTLADLAAACGPGRTAAVCRELTKLHEEVRRGALGDLAQDAGAGDVETRGEFAIVVAALTAETVARADADSAADRLAAARAEVDRLVASGVRHSEAVRQVAAATGVGRRALYDADR